MSANQFTAEQLKNAELWLLPEVEGKHRVSSSSGKSAGLKKQSAAGFRAGKKPQSNSDSLHPVRAMTASRLQQLESSARQRGMENGRAEGYQKGFAEGEEQALQRGAEQLQEQRRCPDQLIGSIGSEVSRETEQLKTVLTELVTRIASELCARELLLQSSIEKVVDQAVAALPLGETNIQVRLNSADLSILESIPGFIQAEWRMQADDSIGVGGCKVKSRHSEVDFTRSEQLSQIFQSVFDDAMNAFNAGIETTRASTSPDQPDS